MPLRDLSSFLVVTHDELAAEQAYFSRVAAVLAERQRLVAELSEDAAGANAAVSARLRDALRERLDDYHDSRPLVAGSFSDGQVRRYVGRRALLDENGDEVLVGWRAPAAAPFLHARSGDPRGIVNRRRYQLDGWSVQRIVDEYFDGRPRDLHVEDELFSELRRTRPGELHDILASIEADQAAILEEPLDGLLVIDGGPGTGKTIVALMRLALQIGRDPVGTDDLPLLVVGPTRAYVDYVSGVLPGLGEDDVAHRSIDDLAATKVAVRAQDNRAVERLKGDARMAAVLERAVWLSIRAVGLRFSYPGAGQVVVPREVVAALVARTARGAGYRAARETFRDRVAAWVAERVVERDPRRVNEADLPAAIRRSQQFRFVDRHVWPTFTAHQLLRELFASPARLGEAADGDLSGDELQMLYRATSSELAAERWTAADLPLLDELEHVLDPRPEVTYRHAIVDEAQDLTPMQLRIVARRCPDRSITLVGDLVQATGPYPHRTWDSVTAPMRTEDSPVRVRRLRYGYRVPRQVATVAEQILRRMDPDIDPPRFVGDGLGEVHDVTSDPATVVDDVVRLVSRIAAQSRAVSVGVITPVGDEEEVRAALVAAGIRTGGSEQIRHPVAVLAPHQARGLEFTHVVVMRPGSIVDEDTDGYKRLYVAVTRCCEYLGVVHCGEWSELRRPYTAEQLRESGTEKLAVLCWMLCFLDRADCCSVIAMARRPLPRATDPDEDVAVAALVAIVESEARLMSRLIRWVEERFAELAPETG